MATCHTALLAKLAEIDGITAGGNSHIARPDGFEPGERLHSAKVLEKMELVREAVEAALTGA
jgi:hypothetical protein